MKLLLEPSQMTLRFEGLEWLWALKRRIQIPHYAIADIRYESDLPAVQDFSGQLRMLGAAIPLAFVAGTFRKGDEREFLYVRLKRPGILTVELKPHTLRYDRIRVTCPEDMARSLADWWHAAKEETAAANPA